jgi:hypothetical protein
MIKVIKVNVSSHNPQRAVKQTYLNIEGFNGCHCDVDASLV